MAEETDRQRQRRSTLGHVEAEVHEHTRRLNALNGSLDRVGDQLVKLEQGAAADRADFKEYRAVVKAHADAAKEAADADRTARLEAAEALERIEGRRFSKRQIALMVLAVLAAIVTPIVVALIEGGGHP